ncbi:Hypothetical protein FKW44_006489 [Caligus rogercresseyi]|uniref:Uncharacterized protein n=1 Tax=Caligus rogercresseyi TaxID=217165 RepID=A0A7T8KDE8_CALRO|nr:Hypothetical protein FKW44_006489 [Caligus rogercresseyi]
MSVKIAPVDSLLSLISSYSIYIEREREPGTPRQGTMSPWSISSMIGTSTL